MGKSTRYRVLFSYVWFFLASRRTVLLATARDEAGVLPGELRAGAARRRHGDGEADRRPCRRAALSRHRSEAETRRSIDEALRRVGWEVDTNLLNRKCNKTMPQRGHNMAIAEWPTGDSAAHPSGYADYALFLGEKLVGIIEAKAEAKDVYAVLDGQGRDYPSAILDEDRRYTLGEWQIGTRTYRVPFTFATNGRPYFAQYEEKSGIWFQDLRVAYSTA